MEQYIITAASSVLVAIIGAISAIDHKRRKQSEARSEARAEIRAEESRLSMAMMSASIGLGIATALAVEKHKINGEMKAAKEKAAKAQTDYNDFLKKIAARQVAKH